jgi:hypothetical protein
MLTCHECYKIALFCGLSPPLDKSRTVVTVRDTGSLIEKGAQVVFYNGGVDIFLNKRCIAQGQQIRSLYWVFMQPQLNLLMDTQVLAASANLETWHQHMGHLSYETVKAINQSEPLSVSD